MPPPTPRKKSNNILQVQPQLGSPPPKVPPKEDTGAKEQPDVPEEDKGDKEDKEDKEDKDKGAKPAEAEEEATLAGTPKDEKAESTTPAEQAKEDEADEEDDDDLDFLSFGAEDAKPGAKRSTSPTKLPGTKRTISTDTLKSSDAISNLLLGQRGVQSLFRDFSSTLTAKEAEIRQLQTRAEELESQLKVTEEQLKSETEQRVEASTERDRALRDDASAAKVVERYMTFSQKAHETVHGHLGQLRTRGAATQASLRAEAQALRRRLHAESERAKQIRAAAEEMADEVGRESAGRRREIALRLHHMAAEEAREKRMESWLDRVRRARQQPDTVDAEVIGALLDDAVEILSPTPPEAAANGWGRRLLRKKAVVPPSGPTPEDESLARIFLAEELVQRLTEDLQSETERRIELEKQRVAWLAKEAEEGVPAGNQGTSLFDVDTEGEKKEEGKVEDGEVKGEEKKDDAEKKEKSEEGKEEKAEVKDDDEKKGKKGKKGKKDEKEKVEEEGDKKENEKNEETAKQTPSATETPRSASPPQTAELEELSGLFKSLQERYSPIQKLLHDQSVSLANLRASLPATGSSTPSTSTTTSGPAPKRGFRALVRGRSAQDDLLAVLDGLHEVIEDARVDAEIAAADEDRVYQGFAALLGVGASGVVQAVSVLRDARAYTDSRSGPNTSVERLDSRVGDIEHDLALIKRTLHEVDGMEPMEEGKERGKSVWTSLELKTVTPTLRPTVPLLLALESEEEDEPRRRVGFLSTVGRSFSGVGSAPRKVSGFAGLYRPKREQKEEEEALVERKSEDDRVD